MIGQRKSQNKSEVRVIGIDASLTGTGVCCFEYDYFSPFFIPETKLTGGQRLVKLKRRLFEIIDDFKPELVMLEGYSYYSEGKTFEIGEWGGVIKVGLCERDIPFEAVPPA